MSRARLVWAVAAVLVLAATVAAGAAQLRMPGVWTVVDWLLRILGLGVITMLAIVVVDGLRGLGSPRCPDCGLRHGPAQRAHRQVGPDREQIP